MNCHPTGHSNPNPVLAQAAQWLDEGRRVALATVTRTWGSAPRRAGSHMAVASNGDFSGSVSGGCIEGAVIQAAREVIESGRPRSLEFGVTNEMAWEVGLACGGRIHLFVERAKTGVLGSVLQAQRKGREVVLVTSLGDGAQELVEAGSGPEMPGLGGDLVEAVLRADEARVVETERGTVFLRPYLRPPRLIIVGAVHIAQALIPMALAAGFRAKVVDPREGFATADRFDSSVLVRAWPDRAMNALQPDRRTAVIALSHDPKIDDPALSAALASDAFYIGALGSRKTQKARGKRLAAAGFSAASLDRIHGPVGLPIGARTPAEIAVSVLAEVISALRNPTKTKG